MNAQFVLRPVIFGFLLFVSLSCSLGQANAGAGPQSKDDPWGPLRKDLVTRAYEELEKLRADYDKNCRGGAAGSSRCKSLADHIKGLEEEIERYIRGEGVDKSNQSKLDGAPEHVDLGGIDLTDLRLIYVKQSGDRQRGLSHAYSVPFQDGPYDATKVSAGIQLSEKAFLEGLLTPEEKFWVNLNPTEPDRIADPEFGRTEVARVLLEADLRMKKDAAAITDPRYSVEAKSYWQRLRIAGGITGQTREFEQKTRFWIVPGCIEIAGSEDEAYLENAELKVELESEYLGSRRTGESALQESRDGLQWSETIEKEFVLPRLQERVNTAPEYQELRQVFASLILGVWRRQQLAVADIGIGGDPSVLLNQTGWTPRTTWLDYRRSVEMGEYDFTEETNETRGDLTITRTVRYFNGGIDFTHIAIPPLLPIDSKTRSVLQKVAPDRKPVRLGSLVLFSGSRSLGTSLSGSGAAQRLEAASIRNGEFGLFVVGGFLVAVAIFFLALLTWHGVP